MKEKKNKNQNINRQPPSTFHTASGYKNEFKEFGQLLKTKNKNIRLQEKKATNNGFFKLSTFLSLSYPHGTINFDFLSDKNKGNNN